MNIFEPLKILSDRRHYDRRLRACL